MSEVYAQVIITCTTINVISLITALFMWIGTLISDHIRKRKKKKQDWEGKE